MFKVNSKYKATSGVLIVKFEQIFQIVLAFQLLTLNKEMTTRVSLSCHSFLRSFEIKVENFALAFYKNLNVVVCKYIVAIMLDMCSFSPQSFILESQSLDNK